LKKGNGVLVAISGNESGLRRALNKLPFVGVDEARNLNACELLQYRYILFPKGVIENLNKQKNN
jgi:hypothetical protein